jgi:hypothetical protein
MIWRVFGVLMPVTASRRGWIAMYCIVSSGQPSVYDVMHHAYQALCHVRYEGSRGADILDHSGTGNPEPMAYQNGLGNRRVRF